MTTNTNPTRPSPLVLLGLTGRAGAGKDTVAEHLAAEFYVLRYAFALPIKAGLMSMLGLEWEDLEDRERKEAPIPWLGRSPRELMQTLGTEWGRELVAPDVWVRLARRVVEDAVASTRAAVVTSGRKLRAYSGRELLGIFLRLALRGASGPKRRAGFEAWYGPRRPDPGALPGSVSESGIGIEDPVVSSSDWEAVRDRGDSPRSE